MLAVSDPAPGTIGASALSMTSTSPSQILVRNGKGDRDRATMLPAAVRVDLAAHLERVREQHRHDLSQGAG